MAERGQWAEPRFADLRARFTPEQNRERLRKWRETNREHARALARDASKAYRERRKARAD